MGKAAAVASIAMFLAAAGPDEDAPAQLGLTLMLKVLTYDAEFPKHGQGDFVVLVPGDAESGKSALAAASQLEQKAILGRKLTFVHVSPSELEKKSAELKASAVLAPHGTSSQAAAQLVRLSASSKLYTMALDSRLVEQGMMLGVTLNGGKPQLVMNVTAARAAGADFKPTVLKIAKTVQ